MNLNWLFYGEGAPYIENKESNDRDRGGIEENEDIEYLEGVVIYKWQNSYYITNHQSEAKMLPFP